MRPITHSTRHRSVRGVTLVELIVTIVIVSMAATALLGTMSFIAKNSGEAVARSQAVSIASAYLQRASAPTFANVVGFSGSASDFNGNAIGQYQVNVAVQPIAAFGPVGRTVAAKKITVTVTHPTGTLVTLIGYRTAHP